MFDFGLFILKLNFLCQQGSHKSNKSATTLSSISVGDCVANIDDDYKDTPLNVEVTDQGSTNKDNIVGIPTLLGPFSDKIIA